MMVMITIEMMNEEDDAEDRMTVKIIIDNDARNNIMIMMGL